MLRTNPLKPKLRDKGWVLGTFLNIPSPQIVEILGLAGFDFVVIDCEHAAIGPEKVEDLIRASLSTGISAMVRVPQCDPVAVRLPLDFGAAGIHVPQVESLAIAESAVRYSHYFPAGERGLQPYVRSASYRFQPTAEYLPEANASTTVTVHIEGRGGMRDLAAIAAVPGIDVLFLGPYDLSQALGIPGQVKDVRVEEAILGAVAAHGKDRVIGTFCDGPEDVIRWRGLGVRYLTMGIDVGMFGQAARDLVLRAQM